MLRNTIDFFPADYTVNIKALLSKGSFKFYSRNCVYSSGLESAEVKMNTNVIILLDFVKFTVKL